MNKVLEGNEAKYNVIVGKEVKRFCVSKSIAENYVSNLSEGEQHDVKIIPVTDDGQEILLG